MKAGFIMGLKDTKKGDKVVLLGFTGIRLSEVVITAANKTSLTVEKKNGEEMTFARSSGIQTNTNNEKYANKIVDPADAPAPKKKAEGKKDDKNPKADNKKPKAGKSTEPVETDEDEGEDDDEEEETPKQKKARLAKEKAAAEAKAKAKADKKKGKGKASSEEDDDEYEEV
jgi:type IV secretory pathway VirB10-like protein